MRSTTIRTSGSGSVCCATSSGLYVADREPYAAVDLRVDLHPAPVAELRRLADAYFPLIEYYNLRPVDPRLPPAAEWLAARRS